MAKAAREQEAAARERAALEARQAEARQAAAAAAKLKAEAEARAASAAKARAEVEAEKARVAAAASVEPSPDSPITAQPTVAPTLGVASTVTSTHSAAHPYGTVPHQRPKPAWRRPSGGSNGAEALGESGVHTNGRVRPSSPPRVLSERARAIHTERASGHAATGAAIGGGAVGGIHTDEAQRAALLEHMRKHGLKVADVLRLCAAIMDDSERI